MLAGLRQNGNKKTKVIVQAGDGATFDIGIGMLSGMWQRGEDITYICYDTEGYSNTGFQASASANLKKDGIIAPKKNMLAIAIAHGVPYVAQSTSGYIDDIARKVKKALETPGPSYIQILSPCMPGWKISADKAVNMGKLAVQTGLYPLLEFINGKLSSSSIRDGVKITPIEEYISPQGRFSKLKKNEVAYFQRIVDSNIKRYKI